MPGSAFFAMFVRASIAIAAVLWQHVSLYWVVAGAVPVAITVAWALSLIRPVRRLVSAIVEWFFVWWLGTSIRIPKTDGRQQFDLGC
jgi:hypothetical protein